ncbi:MAG: hypothetical protein IT288_11375 [Bdellovibrionales bacterium]|nr:hypothetical protein [Bdellovibrionales bacterium]
MKSRYPALLLCALTILGNLSAWAEKPKPELIEVPVSIRYVAQSHWTEAEVLARFNNAAWIFRQSCGIQLNLQGVVRVEDPNLQDINGGFNDQGIKDKIALKESGPAAKGVTLLYVRKVYHEENTFPLVAQAYVLGDRRSPGNLYLEEFPRVQKAHGIAVLSEHYSTSHPQFATYFHSPNLTPYDVDAHELGHLLLNSTDHDKFPGNLMSINGAERTFKQGQCERMRTYHEREHVLKRQLEQDYSRYMRNSTRRLRARPW